MKYYLSIFLATVTIFGSLISVNARAANYVVPKIIYHHGQYELLMADVTFGNIPQEAWDTFVVGDKSPWPVSRRGLYGSSTPQVAEAFSKIPIARPWFVGIVIKDQCRLSEVVASDSFEVEKNPQKYFPIAKDQAGPESWYIRDRNCIQNILGTSDEFVQFMIKLPHYWSEQSRAHGFFRQPWESENLFMMLTLALEGSQELNLGTLVKLREVVSLSNLKSVANASQGFWLRSHALSLIDSYLACQNRPNHDVSDIQKATQSAVDRYYNAPQDPTRFSTKTLDLAMDKIVIAAKKTCGK